MAPGALLRRTWTIVEWVALAILIAGVVAMTASCLIQVFSRYVLQHPLSWTEELARSLFVWVAYLSGWLAWRHRAHIALDAVLYLDLGRGTVLRISVLVVESLILAFCLYTFYTNLGLIQLAWTQPSPLLAIPMGLIYAGYNVMVALIALDIIVGWIAGRREAQDVSAEQSHMLSGA